MPSIKALPSILGRNLGRFVPSVWALPSIYPSVTLHYRHFKRHLQLKWPVVHQQLHVIRNTAHRPSTQASHTASRVRPKRKISCAAAQIAATLTISFPRWRHMSLTSYWGQQRLSLTSYPGIDWLSTGNPLEVRILDRGSHIEYPAIHGSDMGKEVSYVHICPEELWINLLHHETRNILIHFKLSSAWM